MTEVFSITLTEIANRIDAHLKRFEGRSWRSRSKLCITYGNYRDAVMVTKEQAIEYLRWLDSGNVGTHYMAAAQEESATR